MTIHDASVGFDWTGPLPEQAPDEPPVEVEQPCAWCYSPNAVSYWGTKPICTDCTYMKLGIEWRPAT